MAELTQKERLQPSLLDRLTDDSPTERRESRDKHVISPSRLRECVRRDLTWLLNTANLATVEDLTDHPHVARFATAPQDQGGAGATVVELRV